MRHTELLSLMVRERESTGHPRNNSFDFVDQFMACAPSLFPSLVDQHPFANPIFLRVRHLLFRFFGFGEIACFPSLSLCAADDHKRTNPITPLGAWDEFNRS